MVEAKKHICDENKTLNSGIESYPYMNDDGDWELSADCHSGIAFDINFCPYCGMKLTGGDKGNG